MQTRPLTYHGRRYLLSLDDADFAAVVDSTLSVQYDKHNNQYAVVIKLAPGHIVRLGKWLLLGERLRTERLSNLFCVYTDGNPFNCQRSNIRVVDAREMHLLATQRKGGSTKGQGYRYPDPPSSEWSGLSDFDEFRAFFARMGIAAVVSTAKVPVRTPGYEIARAISLPNCVFCFDPQGTFLGIADPELRAMYPRRP